jgi:hypothetical protein
MAANTLAAYGIYPKDVALQAVMQTLKLSGFERENICMMVSPRHPIAKIVRDANILSAEREQNSMTAGLMTWLFEFGAVMIPTVGFFIRSQAFLHALVKRDSSPFCGNSPALMGLGFSELDARRFEKELHELGALVFVACAEGDSAARAVEVLRRTGARNPAMLEQVVAAGAAA